MKTFEKEFVNYSLIYYYYYIIIIMMPTKTTTTMYCSECHCVPQRKHVCDVCDNVVCAVCLERMLHSGQTVCPVCLVDVIDLVSLQDTGYNMSLFDRKAYMKGVTATVWNRIMCNRGDVFVKREDCGCKNCIILNQLKFGHGCYCEEACDVCESCCERIMNEALVDVDRRLLSSSEDANMRMLSSRYFTNIMRDTIMDNYCVVHWWMVLAEYFRRYSLHLNTNLFPSILYSFLNNDYKANIWHYTGVTSMAVRIEMETRFVYHVRCALLEMIEGTLGEILLEEEEFANAVRFYNDEFVKYIATLKSLYPIISDEVSAYL